MAHLAASSMSPPHSSPSPSANPPGGFPPAKRQRLSPNPSSPYGLSPNSPNFFPSNISLPGSGATVNGATAMPQPQVAGAMGPPSKSVEKATDTAELADVLASSGIDLKDEESFL